MVYWWSRYTWLAVIPYYTVWLVFMIKKKLNTYNNGGWVFILSTRTLVLLTYFDVNDINVIVISYYFIRIESSEMIKNRNIQLGKIKIVNKCVMKCYWTRSTGTTAVLACTLRRPRHRTLTPMTAPVRWPRCSCPPHRNTCVPCPFLPSCTHGQPWTGWFAVVMCTFSWCSRMLCAWNNAIDINN